MSKNICEALVNEYTDWLRDQICVSEFDGYCEITTPFLDRHNDFLQIYVKESANNLLLTDGGYILSDLKFSGFELNTEKRIDALETILRGFGIKRREDELYIETARKDLAHKKHLLIQAMLAVNDLFVLAQPNILSFFLEDVEAFLNANEIRFIPKVNFTGLSGYSHFFDFAIPKSINAPERLIKAINTPNRNNVSSLIFSWNDTKNSRDKDSLAIAILNDQEKNISEESLIALNSYEIQSLFWSNREKEVDLLIR